MMGSQQTEFLRILTFTIVTIAQFLLGIFLLFYGSETLKFFAIFLLIIETLLIIKLYSNISSMRNYLRR